MQHRRTVCGSFFFVMISTETKQKRWNLFCNPSYTRHMEKKRRRRHGESTGFIADVEVGIRWNGSGARDSALGGSIVIFSGYNALWLMLAFHIVVVVLTARAGNVSKGNIVGIVASTVGVIPVVGMFLHMAAAITILVDAALSNRIVTRTHVKHVEPIRPRPVRREQEKQEDHPF